MTDLVASRAMVWASKVQDIADHARGLTSDAVQSVMRARSTSHTSIDALLDSRRDGEKIDGMRRLTALSAGGEDMSDHFAAVVKNVASSNLEVRKLVYIYIARYAESQPDLALLSINTIQRALSDHNQIVRGMALRCMSSIRVPSIAGIILLAIKRSVLDSSFYVRKNAAVAVRKLHALDPTQLPQCVDVLRQLLDDDSPAVLESALHTYAVLCPDRVELLHPHYRRICGLLPRMGIPGQVDVMHLLTRYARRCFKPASTEADFFTSTSVDRDLQLLLNSVRPLLDSAPSVVLAAAALLHDLSGTVPVDSLIALLRQPAEVCAVVLQNIIPLVASDPSRWRRHAQHFFVYPSHPPDVYEAKIAVLTLLADDASVGELIEYSSDKSDASLRSAAITALGRCGQSPSLAPRCLEVLFAHVRSDQAVDDAVVAIRAIVRRDPQRHAGEIKSLARSLDTTSAPTARASIFWLVGEYASLLPTAAPDVLRIGVRSFASEAEIVRMQIVVLGVKLYVNEPTQAPVVAKLYKHLMQLVRYDRSYDLRDRCRTYRYLASSPSWVLTQKLLGSALAPQSDNDAQRDGNDGNEHEARAESGRRQTQYRLGSTSLSLDRPIVGYAALPEWATETIGAAERELSSQRASTAKQISNRTAGPVAARTTAQGSGLGSRPSSGTGTPRNADVNGKRAPTGVLSLDDFYASSETTTESDGESDSESDSDGDDSDDSTRDDDDDDEDEAEDDNATGIKTRTQSKKPVQPGAKVKKGFYSDDDSDDSDGEVSDSGTDSDGSLDAMRRPLV